MVFNLNDKFTEEFVLKNEIYQGFIGLFKDQNPLHTDTQFAFDKGFNGIVMHGNILNGFISFFIGEKLPVKDVIIHSQDIQYKNAIYLNDELLFFAEVTGIYHSVNVIEFKYFFKKNTDKIVAKGKFQIGLLK